MKSYMAMLDAALMEQKGSVEHMEVQSDAVQLNTRKINLMLAQKGESLLQIQESIEIAQKLRGQLCDASEMLQAASLKKLIYQDMLQQHMKTIQRKNEGLATQARTMQLGIIRTQYCILKLYSFMARYQCCLRKLSNQRPHFQAW